MDMKTQLPTAPIRMESIDDGGFSLVPFGRESEQSAAPVAGPRATTAPAASRIRDRYILARFPGVMRKSEDFADADEVIKAARLYVEDGLAVRGVELLQFAAEMDTTRESLWLARLQLHYQLRDASGFAAAAKRMHQYHPKSAHWAQIALLGRNLGLAEAFFAELGLRAGPAPKPGAWPLQPNWLQEPRDLTPAVAAAELRSRLLAATDIAPAQPVAKETA